MHNIELFHHKKKYAEYVSSRFEADLQIRTDYHRLWLPCTTLKRFNTRTWLLQKPVVSVSKHTLFQINADDNKLFVFKDNIETFQNQNMEADLFKSVQIIIGFGCHEQH